jgi:beta-lactamase regulating signal transducer with metallopeptidase domain
MNNLFTYLVELNISLMILFTAYKLFFEKDRNFLIRRFFLLGVAVISLILPLLPSTLRMPVSDLTPLSITLEGITVVGNHSVEGAAHSLTFLNILFLVYLAICSLGLIKLVYQLSRILYSGLNAPRFEKNGLQLLASQSLHASSFFGYIFIDPDRTEEESFPHILEHEGIHKREWHSVDRILVELFVVINWFNPVTWMFHRSVVQNLEFMADSAVLRKGTDPMKYQLSILNQYIGSASISNQFSSQIKKRIKMLDKNYKLGSRWKLFLLVPLTLIAFFFVACTEKEGPMEETAIQEVEEIPAANDDVAEATSTLSPEDEIFYIVEDMPTFKGDETHMEFRKFIARNLKYPKEAAEAGVTGKILITFVVTKEGKVVVPDEEFFKTQPKANPSADEVVVAAYRTLKEDDPSPEEKHIKLLEEEVRRVISLSPDWEPGSQRGTKVNVLFTFPVTFTLQ